MEEGTYVGTYKGITVSGFVHGYIYKFDIINNNRTYELRAFKNVTEDDDINLYMYYASGVSIRQNWDIEKEE